MGNTVRDAINKALDEENSFPAFAALAGATIAGLAGNRFSRRFRKMKKGDDVVTPAEVILVPVGAGAGLAYGKASVDMKKRAEQAREGNRRK